MNMNTLSYTPPRVEMYELVMDTNFLSSSTEKNDIPGITVPSVGMEDNEWGSI